jgi:hypothetical protein
MLGFTASILLGSAFGFRLHLIPFLVIVTAAALAAGLTQGLASGSTAAGLLAFTCIAAGLQIGYAAGIWLRCTFDRRSIKRPSSMRDGRPFP